MPPEAQRQRQQTHDDFSSVTCSPLSNQELEKLVSGLAQSAREVFEERAGILQFEANCPRLLAERLAWAEVQQLIQHNS